MIKNIKMKKWVGHISLISHEIEKYISLSRILIMSAQCYMFRVAAAYSITVGTTAIFSSKI